MSVIRWGDWRLHLFLEEWSLDGRRKKIDTNNAIEQYNLKGDPGQANSVALDNKSERDEMLDELLAWHLTVNATIPKERNPDLGKDNDLGKHKPKKRRSRKGMRGASFLG